MAEAARKNLENRNVVYRANAPLRIKSRDLYEGGEVVRAKRDAYLFQEANESLKAYELRLKRATLDPWLEKIIGARQALLFGKEHRRNLPKPLEAMEANVDRSGVPAGVFFADATREAQIDGVHYVLVDMPRMPLDEQGGPVIRTARDESESGFRPFFQHVPAASVIDWELGEDGRLLWAVIEERGTKPRAADGWGVEQEELVQWKVWTRSTWETWETAAGGNGQNSASYVQTGAGLHDLGLVPLVPFYGVRRAPMDGLPVCRTIIPHVVQIYNKESDLDWFERLAAHPIPYAISEKNPEKLNAAEGLWIEARPGIPQSVGYLETTGQGFQSLRESIQDLRYRILSIALAQARKDTAQVQSADSLREDRRIFDSSLRTVASHAQRSEHRCWEIALKWMGKAGEVGIEYNQDYDDTIIEAAMIRELSDLVSKGQLPLEDFIRLLIEGELLPSNYDVEAAVQRIEAREDRLAMAGATRHRDEDEGNEDEE